MFSKSRKTRPARGPGQVPTVRDRIRNVQDTGTASPGAKANTCTATRANSPGTGTTSTAPNDRGGLMEPTRIQDLQPDPENRRRHNPRNVDMITAGLQSVGAARSIVIDEDNTILAGNGVTEAAAAAGITKLRVIDAAGDELIAVRRSGLTPEQKRALAIYDNRTAELAEWNVAQLAADLKDGADLSAFFFDGELAALGALGEGVADPQADYANGMPEFTQADQSAFHTLHVHFKTAEAMEEFSRLIGRGITQQVRYLWLPDSERAVFVDKAYK
jgi:hypothetical protein